MSSLSVAAIAITGALFVTASASTEEKPGAKEPAGQSAAGGKEIARYPDAQASKHVGEEATVTGKVAGVSSSAKGNTYLNFAQAYPNQTFSGVILVKDAAKITEPKQYEGKVVAITGKIEMRNDKPQIVISSPDQIRVVDQAAPPAAGVAPPVK